MKNSKDVVEILKAGRQLISHPSAWTQGSCARNSQGIPCRPNETFNAVCWCSQGALLKVSTSREEVIEALDILNKAVFNLTKNNIGVIMFNDTSYHSQVLETWDKAISLGENIGKF